MAVAVTMMSEVAVSASGGRPVSVGGKKTVLALKVDEDGAFVTTDVKLCRDALFRSNKYFFRKLRPRNAVAAAVLTDAKLEVLRTELKAAYLDVFALEERKSRIAFYVLVPGALVATALFLYGNYQAMIAGPEDAKISPTGNAGAGGFVNMTESVARPTPLPTRAPTKDARSWDGTIPYGSLVILWSCFGAIMLLATPLCLLVWYEKWVSGMKRVARLEALQNAVETTVLPAWQEELRPHGLAVRVVLKSSAYRYIADARHWDTYLWLQFFYLHSDV